MKTIKMLAMAIIIAGMFHANAAKGEEANGIKVEKLWEKQLVNETQELFGVWFSPSDKYILTYSMDTNYIVDSKTGELVRSIKIPKGRSSNLRFISNDSLLLFQSEDSHTINFHTFPNLKVVDQLESIQEGKIGEYNIDSKQKLLIANVDGEKLVLWDLETKKILKEKKIEKFEGEKSGAFSYPAFFPGRDSILVVSTHVYFLGFDIKHNPIIKTVKTLNILNYELDSIGTLDASIRKFSKDGKYAIKNYGNEEEEIVEIIDFNTKKIFKKIYLGFKGVVRNYFTTSDIEYLFVFTGGLNIYRILDGKLLKIIPTGSCYGSEISHFGNEFSFSSTPILYKYSFSEINSVTNVSNSNYLQYSNPIIKDSIVLLIVEHSSKIKIVLSNERGIIIKELTNQYYEEGNYSIDLKTNDLPNGLYFLTLTDDSGSHTQKIIIER